MAPRPQMTVARIPWRNVGETDAHITRILVIGHGHCHPSTSFVIFHRVAWYAYGGSDINLWGWAHNLFYRYTGKYP